MESFKPILEKIKKIKQEKGYTNEVLAQKSGIPLSTLNKILSSVIKDPKIGTLIAITDALDVDINSLIYDNLNIKDKPNPKATDNLEKLANEYHVTKSAIAIAWLLRHPACMQPIMGTTSPAHLKEMVHACDIHLTRQQWYDLYLASDKPLP